MKNSVTFVFPNVRHRYFEDACVPPIGATVLMTDATGITKLATKVLAVAVSYDDFGTSTTVAHCTPLKAFR